MAATKAHSQAPSQLRKQSLQLYSNLLREARGWPFIENRQIKCFRAGLTDQIKSEFRKNQTLKDSQQIITLHKKADRELQALKSIVKSSAMKKYPIDSFFMDPALSANGKVYLSDKFQEEQERKSVENANRSIIGRIFTFLLGDPPNELVEEIVIQPQHQNTQTQQKAASATTAAGATTTAPTATTATTAK